MIQYETVIGLEVHIELSTKTKIFCGCSTAFGGKANSHTCPVCTGMPGSLPVLNKKVLEYAMAVGLAMGCQINKKSHFDRKNYFYPDNPQNYQISQLYAPICHDGRIEIEAQGNKKEVRIHEIHMEEDAGKLIHDEKNNISYVDFNRSGVPLIEIVSEPDMQNAEEVIAYLEKLRLIIRYLGVSDCKIQEGSMRADVNLSVRKKGCTENGTRTEMKNLGSFRAITRAIESEKKRQIELLEKGEKVIQETRRWDEDRQRSYTTRSKEDSKDYRYFPDPDLAPLYISDEWISQIRKRQPEMSDEKKKRYKEQYALPDYDAKIITSSKHMADIFEETLKFDVAPKKVSNWLMGENLRLVKEKMMDIDEISFSPENLVKLIKLVENQTITMTVAKQVFEIVFSDDIDPQLYVKEHGLGTVNDDSQLEAAIKNVLKENEQSVTDYKAGKQKAAGYLIGQTMKAMGGKANPQLVREMIEKMLNE